MRARVILVLLLAVGLVLSLVFARSLWRSDVMVAAEVEANRTIDRLNAARLYYMRAGAERAASGGLQVLMDYRNKRTALPFPETFMHELASIYSSPPDVAVFFYSPLPFKGRATHKFDRFQANAWKTMNDGIADRYSKLVDVVNHSWMRVARADRLNNATCVECHNRHPQSQKRDWKLGDLRGIVEVSMDINARLAGIDRALLSIGMAALALILGAAVLAGRLGPKSAALAGAGGAAAGAAGLGDANLPSLRQEEAAFSLATPPLDEHYEDEFEPDDGDFPDENDRDADFMHDEIPEPPPTPKR